MNNRSEALVMVAMLVAATALWFDQRMSPVMATVSAVVLVAVVGSVTVAVLAFLRDRRKT